MAEGKKNTPALGPGRARVEAFRKREAAAVTRVAEGARAAEEAFWEETGASHYREAEELARSLHEGR